MKNHTNILNIAVLFKWTFMSAVLFHRGIRDEVAIPRRSDEKLDDEKHTFSAKQQIDVTVTSKNV